MQIKLSPQRRDDELEIKKSGDALTINGIPFDLSPVGEGDTLPSDAIYSDWFAGPVERIEGQLVLTILLPLPKNFSPAQAFPSPLMDVPDGVVALPQPISELPVQSLEPEQ